MHIRKLGLFIAAAVVILSLSCTMLPGLIDTSENTSTPGSPRFAKPDCDNPKLDDADTQSNGTWPDSVSSEIPPLEENISTVFVTDTMVRIFYSGITTDRINDYLDLLEQHGFTLEPIVYVREGFPDNSAEKISKGDFDAIEARKGNLYIRIEFGCDSTDMVIETR
jgi:hypothetical protein